MVITVRNHPPKNHLGRDYHIESFEACLSADPTTPTGIFIRKPYNHTVKPGSSLSFPFFFKPDLTTQKAPYMLMFRLVYSLDGRTLQYILPPQTVTLTGGHGFPLRGIFFRGLISFAIILALSSAFFLFSKTPQDTKPIKVVEPKSEREGQRTKKGHAQVDWDYISHEHRRQIRGQRHRKRGKLHSLGEKSFPTLSIAESRPSSFMSPLKKQGATRSRRV